MIRKLGRYLRQNGLVLVLRGGGRIKRVLFELRWIQDMGFKYLDYTDRNTCILFGDAAVAMLIEKTNEEGKLAANAICSNLLQVVNEKTIEKERLFEQDGRGLYEYVVKNIPVGISKLLDKSGLTINDIDWFVPHSANLRMIEALAKRINIPMERTLVSNEFYGNTSSASIPLALWLAVKDAKIKLGDKLLLYGFGAGLTHAGLVIRWN